MTGMLGNVVAAKSGRGGRRKKRTSIAASTVHNGSLHVLGSPMPTMNGIEKELLSFTPKKVLRNNTSNNKGRGRGKHEKVESHKITEYFPVRRSERKTGKQLEEEETAKMEEAICSGSCEAEISVYKDELKGRGIRSTRVYLKNEFVVEYKGDMIEYEEAKIREAEYAKDPSIGSYMYFFKFRNKHWCVDATKESKYKGRLVNHSALRPNLKTKVVEFHGIHHLILVARRDIDAGEELLYDYGDRTASTIAQNPWLINS